MAVTVTIGLNSTYFFGTCPKFIRHYFPVSSP